MHNWSNGLPERSLCDASSMKAFYEWLVGGRFVDVLGRTCVSTRSSWLPCSRPHSGWYRWTITKDSRLFAIGMHWPFRISSSDKFPKYQIDLPEVRPEQRNRAERTRAASSHFRPKQLLSRVGRSGLYCPITFLQAVSSGGFHRTDGYGERMRLVGSCERSGDKPFPF